METNISTPHVAILMTTFNGARFLPAQLESICAQSRTNWTLWISDDGSSDNTLEVIRGYRDIIGTDRLFVISGPRLGFQRNFLGMAANDDIKADYYAWADQDDVWLPCKLAQAMDLMEKYGRRVPVLYCGRTILVNDGNRAYGFSPLMTRRPAGFGNALMQSLGGGNTMMFNNAARDLIRLGDAMDVPAHDWWAYMIVSGAGGHVVYDPEPTLRYRQHGRNVIGSNQGLHAKMDRVKGLLKGRYKLWNEANIQALSQVSQRLAPGSREQLDAFIKIRQSDSPLYRLRSLKTAGLHRQTLHGDLALFLAALCKLL